MIHSIVQLLQSFAQFLHLDRFGWRSLFDILVLSVIIYQILRIFRGTRAFRMLSGILVLAGSAWGRVAARTRVGPPTKG